MKLFNTKIIVAAVVLFSLSSCDTTTLTSPAMVDGFLEDVIGIDGEEKILLYNGENVDLLQESLFLDHDEISFKEASSQTLLGEPYSSEWRGNSYDFFRTELPILKIQTRSDREINETYESSQFALIENGQITLMGNLGIRLRGNTSLSFPKKSYRIELWDDDQGFVNRDASILGMRNDDDWLLDGMWNEPLSIRDKSAMELWLDFGRVHYAGLEEDVVLGAARAYCELFVNGTYQGLYYIGERLDRKQLKLETFTGQFTGGELYKAKGWDEAVIAFSLPEYDNNDLNWGGYEIKYPEEVGEYDWGKLKELIAFFKFDTPRNFEEVYTEKIDIDNIIDYFILINLLSAFDNAGNNVYIARRNQTSPYYFVSWDYDATLGLGITGDEVPQENGFIQHVVTRKLLSSATFQTELKVRWEYLRKNILSNDNIKSYYRNNYSSLLSNRVYQREEMILRLKKTFPGLTSMIYLEENIDARLQFLDEAIENL